MFSNFQLAGKYLWYYLHASNSKGHGMHSPFVFRFIKNVLNDPGKPNGDLILIESCRRALLSDNRVLHVEDLGAGSRSGPLKKRTVKQIAGSALKPSKLAAVLYRLVKYYKPVTIIELGTSLGITTNCFSKAMPSSRIITIEGSQSIAGIAKENFQKLDSRNIELIQGNFDHVLNYALDSVNSVDLVYIDGNHRYQPTIDYFQSFLEKSNENSIMVFDDIHWSKEMEEAWNEIKSHPSVKYTIDVFFLGFVFFKEEFKVKQDFIIRL